MYDPNFFRALGSLLLTSVVIVVLGVLGLLFTILFTEYGSVAVALLSAAAVIGSGLYLVVYKALK